MVRIVKLLIGLLVVATVAVAGLGFYVKSSLQPEALRKLVQERGTALLGRPVTVGAASLDWTGAAHLEGLKIADQSGIGDQLAVQGADVRFSILGLFSGTYGLSKVTLTAPRMTLTRRSDGSHDLQDVVDKLAAGGSSEAGAGARVMPTLALSGGELTVISPEATRTVKALDLEVWGDGGILSFQGSGQVDERRAMLEGKLDPAAGTLVVARGAIEGLIPGSRLRLGHGTLSYQGKTRSLRLDQVMIGESRGKVSVDLAEGGALQGLVEFSGVDLVTAHPALKRGQANLKLSLGGTLDAPKVEGGGDLKHVVVQKSEGDHEIQIDSGQFAFTELKPDPLSLVISLQAFQASIPGMSPPVSARIDKGRFRVGPSGIFSEDLELIVSGVPMKPKVEIRNEGKEPQLLIDTGAIHVDLGRIGPMLTGAAADSYAKLQPQGEISGGLKVTGTPSSPVMAGGIDVRKVTFRMEGRPEPVTVGPGKVRMGGQKIEVDSLGLEMDPLKVSLTGTVEDLFAAPKFAMKVDGKGLELDARGMVQGGAFTGTTLAGTVEAGALVPGARIEGPVKLALTVAGTTTEPAITGSAEVPSFALRTENGGVMRITEVRSPVEGGKGGIKLSPLTGRFYGGALNGRVELSANGTPAFDVSLDKASVDGFMGDVAGSGDLLTGTMSGRFEGSGIPAKLEGAGEAKLSGMVLTVGRSRAMAMLGIGLKAGEEGAGFLASQAGENIIGGLLKSSSTGAGFFKGVIDILASPVEMGDLSVPLAAQGGVLKAGRFESPAIAGTVSIDLGKQMALGGSLDHLRLGRLGISGIGLGGTVGAPVPKIDMQNLLLDGQPAPMGLSEVGSLLSGKNVGEVVQDTLQNEVKGKAQDLLGGLVGGKKNRKSLESGLTGLLPGGGRGETSVTQPDPPPPSQPDTAAGESAPAEPPPAAESAPAEQPAAGEASEPASDGAPPPSGPAQAEEPAPTQAEPPPPAEPPAQTDPAPAGQPAPGQPAPGEPAPAAEALAPQEVPPAAEEVPATEASPADGEPASPSPQ